MKEVTKVEVMETLCPSSAVWNSSWVQSSGGSAWTKEENKRFESALAIFDDKTPNRWFKVAEMIPGKSVYDVINQYRELVADVTDIEAGLVPIPGYLASSFTLELADDHLFRKRPRNTTTTCDQERKKGVPWTEEEHRYYNVNFYLIFPSIKIILARLHAAIEKNLTYS